MNRSIAGLPIWAWVGALGLGLGGFWWVRNRSGSAKSKAPGTPAGAPAFTQAQEVQDFQIFSALTSATQASDLNFLGQVASLFSGGSSTGTTGGVTGGGGGGGSGTSVVPSPPSTGSAPPATVPASSGEKPTAVPASTSLPGYGAGVAELAAANPGILQANSPGGPNIPGITGYQVSYNGVPL